MQHIMRTNPKMMVMMEYLTNITLLHLVGVLIVSVALAICFTNRLFLSIISMGLFSLFCCLSYILMDAPDVALTEAALGACIITVVMLKLAIDTKPGYNILHKQYQITGAISCLIFLSVMIWAGLDLPEFGDIRTPIHQHVTKYYHDNAFEEIGVKSFVAAILASYRGFDTLGETLVIFTGGIAALFILSHMNHSPDVNFKSNIIIETCSKISAPVILVFVIYIQILGTTSPGGGFQAGAILASLIMGLNLSYGFIFDTKSLIKIGALGLCIYVFPGMVALLLNYQFLDYNALPFGDKSQKIGIEIIEVGICLTVASTLTLLYYTFFTTKLTKVS